MRQQSGKHWNTKRYEQKGSHLKLAFDNENVRSVRFGQYVQIYLGDDFMTRIDLWMPFNFIQYGQTHVLSPNENTTLAPLLSIIWAKIVKATVGDHRPLVIEFDNGIIIEAPSDHTQYRWEAWEINDRHGFHIVCAIGGKMAIWLPDAETSRRRNKEGNIWFD